MVQSEMREAPEGDNQLELFVPGFVDVAFRDQQDLMENPLCTLGKTPRKEPIRYQVGTKFVVVSGSTETGIATIYDHDILIWAATQIREAADRGEPTSQTIHFHPYNLLKSIRRDTGGRQYELLKQSIRRLNGTLVETNIRENDEAAEAAAALESGQAPSKRKRGKKSVRFTLLQDSGETDTGDPAKDTWWFTLPNWFYNGVLNHRLVLSIDPDYFLLESGIERWLYRVFRKHAGGQETGWLFTMKQLHTKSGTSQRFSNFALEVRKAVERANKHGKLPGYVLEINRNSDGEEIVSGQSRARLGMDDPRFQPPPNPGRRKGLGFTNVEKWDNTGFANLLAEKRGVRAKGKNGEVAPSPALPGLDDDIPF